MKALNLGVYVELIELRNGEWDPKHNPLPLILNPLLLNVPNIL